MKKSLWLLLAVAALVAVFAVAGCTPTGPEPTTSPEPTEEPTTPPADYCPTEVKTVVTALYCGTDATVNPNFSILLTFDKDIVLLDDEAANWEVKVERVVPYEDTEGDLQEVDLTGDAALAATVSEVVQVGSNQIRIKAKVGDSNTALDGASYYGLICTEGCYEAYVALIAGADDPTEGYADKVIWEYTGTGFPYADALGNVCSCDVSGEACCVACEECAEPEEPLCPLGEICY